MRINSSHGGTIEPMIGDICSVHFSDNSLMNDFTPVTIVNIIDGCLCFDKPEVDWLDSSCFTLLCRPFKVGMKAEYHYRNTFWRKIEITQNDLDDMVRGDKEIGCRLVRDYYRHSNPLLRNAEGYKPVAHNIINDIQLTIDSLRDVLSDLKIK